MLSFAERCAVGHATGLSLRIVVAGDLTLIYGGSLHENQQGNNNTQAARAATGAAANASTTKPSNKRYQAAAFQRHIGQSAEAEALERHTVFSTRVRAEALEQQKAEALKQQEAEALERQRLEAAASGSQSAEAATRPQASPVAKAPRSSPPLCSPSIARNPNVSET